MDCNVLGPLEVLFNGASIPIAAPKQRALLSVLVVHANEVVSSDSLLDQLWGDGGSDGGVGKLRFQVSKLRDALESEQDGDRPSAVVTDPPGYRLVVDPDSVDALRFERLVAEARRLPSSEPEEGLELLDEALGLWRGPAYAEFAYEEWAQSEIRRLTELRLEAIEDRFDMLALVGRSREILAEAEELVTRYPRRERLCGALMLALYRSGRQSAALAVFQDLRRELAEGLGIDPSVELQNLEEAILLHDPSLVSDRDMARDRLRGYVLRGEIGEGAHGIVYRAAQSGVGREVAIKTIRADLANDRDFVRRFEAEAQLVASLEHPHIVSLFDFWRDPDGAYLVMPYLQGGSLAERLDAGPIEPDEVRGLVDRIGSALGYAHRRGVIHRDVTPDNVLLDDDGNPYLADFGVAALLGPAGTATSSSPGYLPPEVLSGGAALPASDVFSLGVLCHAALTGVAPLAGVQLQPVSSLRPGLPVGVDGVVARATTPGIAERYGGVDEFVAELDMVLGGTAPIETGVVADVRNPFKGLRAFSEADAQDFFGRQALTEELVGVVGRNRLVGVVGPSGCGKSSLVRAGLIPRIRAGDIPGSERWLVTDMYPGSRPFSEMEAALLRVAVTRPTSLTEALTCGGDGWREVADALLPAGTDVFLIVDQFEELFTLTIDAGVRLRFLETLADLASDPLSRVRVVVTIRADFYDRPLEHPAFGDMLRKGLVSIAMPDDESLADAVVGPAQRVGLSLEAGLTETIVTDVADQPGGLPLMEYALTEMFNRRTGPRLTFDDYLHAGGVLGALGRRAEDLYAGADDEGRAAIRQVFLRLVAVEEGSVDTRRRIAAIEVSMLGIEPETLEGVLRDYGSHRLVTYDRDPHTRAPTIEVAHEALLSRWERLRAWIDDIRDDLVLRRHLATAVSEWDENDRDDAYLLTIGRLDHYEAFAASTDLALTKREWDYLGRSREHIDTERTRRRHRRQMILAGFAAVAVIALVFAAAALLAKGQADDATAVARSRELAASAISVLAKDPELSLLLAVEAAQEDAPFSESLAALHEAVIAQRILLVVDVNNGLIAPDGATFVTMQRDVIQRHDVSTGGALWTAEGLGAPWIVEDGFFTPDGSRFVSIPVWDPEEWDMDDDSLEPEQPSVLVLDVATGDWMRSALEYDCDLDGLIPDGHARVSVDRPVLVRAAAVVDGECDPAHVATLAVELESGQVEELVRFDGSGVSGRAWTTTADGRYLALGFRNRTTVIDLDSGERREYAQRANHGANYTISHDGGLVLTSNALRSTAHDVLRDDAAVTFSYGMNTGGTWFTSDESLVVNGEGTWDMETGDSLVTFLGREGFAPAASISDDGTRAVTSDIDGVVVWDVSAHGEVGAVAALKGFVQPGSVDAAGGRGAAVVTRGDVFGTAVVFDPYTGEVVYSIDSVVGPGVALSPDGALLAVQEETESESLGAVVVHDVSSGAVSRMEGICLWNNHEPPGQECRPYPEVPFAAFVRTLQFLAHGTHVAAGIQTVDGAIMTVVWDVTTGRIVYHSDPEDEPAFPASGPEDDSFVVAHAGEISVVEIDGWSTVDRAPVEGTLLRFTSDGLRLVTDHDGITVYDTQSWTPEIRLEKDVGFWRFAISPDDEVVVTADWDGLLRVYDLQSGAILQTIPIGEEIVDVEFITNTHVLVAPRSGPGVVVTIDVEELLEIARERLTRGFSEEECAAYQIDPCPSVP